MLATCNSKLTLNHKNKLYKLYSGEEEKKSRKSIITKPRWFWAHRIFYESRPLYTYRLEKMYAFEATRTKNVMYESEKQIALVYIILDRYICIKQRKVIK